MEKTVKLLIIDDFQLSALGTKALLAGFDLNFDIFTAFSVDEGIEVLNSNDIDIVLSDVFMPEKDGFQALDIVKQKFPLVKFMFLSISEEKDAIYKAFAFRADGYQFKDVSKDELVHSLKVLISGKKYFHPRIINILYDDLNVFASNFIRNNSNPSFNIIDAKPTNLIQHKNNARSSNPEDVLTEREIGILRLIGEGVSTNEMAERLGISAFTVSAHRKNLYIKLGLDNLTQMKQYAKEYLSKSAV